jgi:hypothetical protein
MATNQLQAFNENISLLTTKIIRENIMNKFLNVNYISMDITELSYDSLFSIITSIDLNLFEIANFDLNLNLNINLNYLPYISRETLLNTQLQLKKKNIASILGNTRIKLLNAQGNYNWYLNFINNFNNFIDLNICQNPISNPISNSISNPISNPISNQDIVINQNIVSILNQNIVPDPNPNSNISIYMLNLINQQINIINQIDLQIQIKPNIIENSNKIIMLQNIINSMNNFINIYNQYKYIYIDSLIIYIKYQYKLLFIQRLIILRSISNPEEIIN